MALSNYAKNIIQKKITELLERKQKQLSVVGGLQKKVKQEQGILATLNKKIQALKADIQ